MYNLADSMVELKHNAQTVGGLEDGARGRVEGDYEGMHKCEIDI